MAKRERPGVERYHDRVAGIYDTIYEGNPYWEMVFTLTWRHVRKVLPAEQSIRCLDVGCGTGRWGLKLWKSGYATDFLDISRKMLDQVERKLARDFPSNDARILHTGLDDLSELPSAAYGFVIGQGDPLCSAQRPERAFKELTRILAPGGVLMMSVDNTLAGVRHFFREEDLPGLKRFLKTGRTHWVTDAEEEQYPIKTFTPDEIRAWCAGRGLELLSLIGKTALPLRRYQALLKDRASRETLLRLEESLHAKEAMLGGAAHLEFAARKPAVASG
jgi:SAM-dependent methyltransferase